MHRQGEFLHRSFYALASANRLFSDHVHDKVLVDYCDAGPKWDPVQSAYFYHLDPNTSRITRMHLSTDQDTTSHYTSFFYFSGRWGDKQYPDSDWRQETIPYFKLKRFQTGPTGPRAKQLIRNGLFPDHQHIESWTEWGVGVYMSWYPCCLQGWRVYMSGLLVIGVILTTLLGVIVSMRRLRRRRDYEPVDGDIPLLQVGDRGSFDSLDSR
jgi:hypothetical protein